MGDVRGIPFSVATSGTVIRGMQYGDGPALVLLHGGPGCYDYFSGTVMVDWLTERHGVRCYDQRGCRGSTSKGPFTVAASVADLEAVRRHIGMSRISLLGHSAGAVLALHYAAAYPDHVGELVLMSSAGVRPGWRPAFDAIVSDRLTAEERSALEGLDHRIVRTGDRAARGELIRRRFNLVLPCYAAPRHRGRAMMMAFYHREVNLRGNASMQSLERETRWQARLRDFRGRACIIHGRSDPIPWRVVDDLHEILPDAAVFPLAHCGHFPWLEEPEACRAALVAFLGNPG